VGDAAMEGRAQRELLVEVHGIGVAGDAREHQDVGIGDRLAEDGRHALGQILDEIAVEAHVRTLRAPDAPALLQRNLTIRSMVIKP
jgi:hypothetical protein